MFFDSQDKLSSQSTDFSRRHYHTFQEPYQKSLDLVRCRWQKVRTIAERFEVGWYNQTADITFGLSQESSEMNCVTGALIETVGRYLPDPARPLAHEIVE